MYTDDWFYTLSTFPFIEKALNSNHLSLKHVFKQLSTDWLDVTEIDSLIIGIRILIFSMIWTL